LTLLFLAPLILTNRVLAGLDVLTYFYPYRQYAAEALRIGRIPFWDPYLFMGVPFLANPQAGVFYPPNLLLTGLDAPEAVKATIAFHLALATVSAYLWARVGFRFGVPGALVTGMAFGLGGFLGAQAEHVNQLSTSAWLPLELALVDLALPNRWEHDAPGAQRARGWAWGALGAVLGVSFLAGHAQAWTICTAGVALYTLLPGVRRLVRARHGDRAARLQEAWRALREVLLLAGAVALGLALAALQFLPTLELARLSVRSGGLPYREAVSFSLRPGLILYSLLPAYGEDLSQVFASPAWTEYVGYAGVLCWVLALAALLEARDKRALAVGLAFAGAGLFLALGGYNPFYPLLYLGVPGVRSFRAPARWLLWWSAGMALLAGAGVEACAAPWRRLLRERAEALHTAWRRARWPARAGLVALAAVVLAALWLMDLPAPRTLALWGGIALLGALTIGAASRGGRWRSASQGALVLLVALELFAASRPLPYNWPTAREAYASMRTAPAFLRTDASLFRFLSLSDIRYDPGDLLEMRQVLGPQLPERAVYDFVVAAKEKEILAPNLPLLFRVPSVDGYDGGVLPLKRYVAFLRLFLPEEAILPDGRLREQLKEVPPTRLLNLVGVKYVITDKVQDVWVDGFYYDLEHTAWLGAGLPDASVEDLPRFPTTALGLVSHLRGAADLPEGTPVAEVTLTGVSGRTFRWTLQAGRDTAEGKEPRAHPPARAVHAWRDDPAGHDYLTVLRLPEMVIPRSLQVRSLLSGEARLALRGMSLLNHPTETGQPVVLSSGGRFRLVHSGDVKVYENLDFLPRAHLVHRATVEPDDGKALTLLGDPAFDPAQEVVLAEGRALAVPPPHTAEAVAFVRYEPEEVVLRVSAGAEGYLVLADTWYPGWQATVDGQPADLARANILFRAVYLPPGEHEVRMVYAPRAWAWGWPLSLVAVGILVAVLAADLRRARPSTEFTTGESSSIGKILP
jgi:hypothetical protein